VSAELSFLISLVSAAFAAGGAYAAVRVELRLMRDQVREHAERLTTLERKG
jgi:hypothetical protein